MINKYSNDSLVFKNGTIQTGKLKPDQVESSSSLFSYNPQQHKRILIVDDDSDTAFTFRLGLKNSDPNIQVYSFENPITALLEFKPDFYDLLLIDINMPLMDGFQLTQKLLQKDLNVRVCFMTSGEINMDAAREVHTLKCIGCFIKKPITRAELD